MSGAEKYLLPCFQAEARGVSEYPVSAEVTMSPASPLPHDFSSSRHCTVQGKVGLYIIVYIILLLYITYNIYVTMYYLLQVMLRCLAKEGGVLVQYSTTQQPRGARIIGNTGQQI